MYLLLSNTESCDEDDDEVSVDVVEELVDKSGNHKWYIIRYIAINSLAISDEMWFFDRWSNDMYTHDPLRVSPRKELREFLQEA